MLPLEAEDTLVATTMTTPYDNLTVGQSADYAARHLGGHQRFLLRERSGQPAGQLFQPLLVQYHSRHSRRSRQNCDQA